MSDWEVRVKLPEAQARKLFEHIFDQPLTSADIKLFNERGELVRGWSGNKPDSFVFKHGRNL